MKKIIPIFLILFWSFTVAKAQIHVKQSIMDSITMGPEYPGCESVDRNLKMESVQCMSNKLNVDIANRISKHTPKLMKQNIQRARTTLMFVLTAEGKIDSIRTVNSTNDEFSKLVLRNFETIVKSVKIKPALHEDQPINLGFAVPVIYQQQNVIAHKIYWKEMVLMTLDADDKLIEFRQDKSDKLRIYEVQTGKSKFIQKINSIQEALEQEPYQSIFLSNPGRIKIAEKTFKGILYRMYVNEKSNDKVDIYKLINGEEVWFDTLLKNEIQFVESYFSMMTR